MIHGLEIASLLNLFFYERSKDYNVMLVTVVRKECGVRRRVCFPRLFLDSPRAIVSRVMAAHEKVKQQNYRFTRENESKNIVQNQYFMFWTIYIKLLGEIS